MKKNLLKTVILLIAVTFVTLQSCEKKEFVKINEEKPKIAEKIYSEEGILVFENQDVFNETVNSLANLSEAERRKWEEKLGFKSIFSIYNEINDAEIALENELYAGYDESLSKEELSKLGLPVDVHTDLYNKYINKGLIKEVKDTDGSEAFYMNTIDPVAALYTDENGLMVINDTLYQYTPTQIKIMPGNVSDKEILMNAKSTDKGSNIYIVDFSDKSTISGYNWSKSSNWKYETSKKRYRMDISGWSWTYGPNDYDYMGSKFWPDLKAERKRWGNWKRRSSYTPVKQLYATWSYKYTISQYWYGGYPRTTHYNDLSGGGTSPINVNYGHTNYGTYQYCNPTGNWSSSWYFTHPVDVYDFYFKGYFDPGNIILTE